MELKLPKNIDHCFKRNSRIDSRFQLDKVNIRNTDAQDIKKQLLDLCNQVTEPLEIKSHLNLIGSFILQGECLDSVSQQALLDFLTNRMKATRCLAEKHPHRLRIPEQFPLARRWGAPVPSAQDIARPRQRSHWRRIQRLRRG